MGLRTSPWIPDTCHRASGINIDHHTHGREEAFVSSFRKYHTARVGRELQVTEVVIGVPESYAQSPIGIPQPKFALTTGSKDLAIRRPGYFYGSLGMSLEHRLGFTGFERPNPCDPVR